MSKVGIIGCGKQAYKHIDGLKKHDQNISIIVSDLNQDAAKSLSADKNVEYVDFADSIIGDPTVDAVVICTPPSSHFEFIMQSLDAGKNVFCEKPLCETKKQAEEIEKKSLQCGKFVQVGYVYRYVPAFVTLKRLLGDTDMPLGEGVFASFRIGGRGSHQVWKHRLETNGGATSEMLVHMLDLAIWLFGPLQNFTWLERKLLRPQRVINGKLENVDAEDYVLASCESKKGVKILFQADLVTPAFRQSLEVQGANGSYTGSIQGDVNSYIHLIEAKGDYSSGRTDINVNSVNLFNRQMEEFLDNAERGDLGDSPGAAESIIFFDVLKD